MSVDGRNDAEIADIFSEKDASGLAWEGLFIIMRNLAVSDTG